MCTYSIAIDDLLPHASLHCAATGEMVKGSYSIAGRQWCMSLSDEGEKFYIKITVACYYDIVCMTYRIVSNLTDISNYPDTISNYFFTSNYTDSQ